MANPDRSDLQPDVYADWDEDAPTPDQLGTAAATPGTIPLRDSAGAVSVGPATADSHAVNRAQMVAADSDLLAFNLMGVF